MEDARSKGPPSAHRAFHDLACFDLGDRTGDMTRQLLRPFQQLWYTWQARTARHGKEPRQKQGCSGGIWLPGLALVQSKC